MPSLPRRLLALLAAGAFLAALGSSGLAGPADAATLDLAALARTHAPKGWTLGTVAVARGLQNYMWAGGAWQPRGATADLRAGTEASSQPGAAYPGPGGPTWDFGSDRLVLATSEPIEGAAGDDLGWARLCVRTVTTQGTNGGWSYVLQVGTKGGKAPTPPVGAAEGMWTAVPFGCTYLFLMPSATASAPR